MDRRNCRVDQFRFLAAFSVVLNHGLYAHKLPLVSLAGRWTVPFFFLVSGYFFYHRYTHQPHYRFAQTAKPLLIMLAVANGIYLLFVGLTTGSLSSLANHFTLLVGTFFHLWFLTSMLIGYILLWVCLSCKLQALLPYLAVGVFILILALNAYHHLFALSAHPIYARSLLSILFLTIGFLLAKHKLTLRLDRWVAYALVLVGMSVQMIEAHWLAQTEQDWLRLNFLGGTLLLSVGVFLVAFQGSQAHSSLLSHCGRRFSVLIYLYHPMIYYALSKALAATPNSVILYWLSPLLTMMILLAVLVVLDQFSPGVLRLLSGQFSSDGADRNLAQKPAPA